MTHPRSILTTVTTVAQSYYISILAAVAAVQRPVMFTSSSTNAEVSVGEAAHVDRHAEIEIKRGGAHDLPFHHYFAEFRGLRLKNYLRMPYIYH